VLLVFTSTIQEARKEAEIDLESKQAK